MNVHNRIVSYRINMRHPGSTNIVLYDSTNKIVGQYIFSTKISDVTCHQISGGTGPSVNAPLSLLSPVLDLLRNEKPLYFGGHLDIHPPWAYLSTGPEPVGEEESSKY
jgi:hypothetical protein